MDRISRMRADIFNGSSGSSGVETRFTTERTESTEILKGGSPVFDGKNLLKHEGTQSQRRKIFTAKRFFPFECLCVTLCLGSFPFVTEEP
ncbi:MAG: hypothetical protein AB1846_01300, partial [Chloroflexota bacterium]